MTPVAEVINIESGRPYMKADIENGFDRVAHDLTDTLANPPVPLAPREYQVINAIIAKTYRYHKSTDWISNSQLAEATGIRENHVATLKKGLLAKCVLIKKGRAIGINPVISQWQKTPNIGTKNSQNRDKKVPESGVNTPRIGSVKEEIESGKLPELGLITPRSGTNEDPENSQIRDSILPDPGLNTPKIGTKNSQIRDTQKKNTNTKEILHKSSPAKKAKQIPDDFSVTAEMESWAKEQKFTFNVKSETENFKDYWKSKGEPRKDWVAGWRVWMRKAQEYINKNGSPPPRSRARQENFGSTDYGTTQVGFDS